MNIRATLTEVKDCIMAVNEDLDNIIDKIDNQDVMCTAPKSKKHPMIGRYCLLRTYSAGVHLGTVVSADGKEVLLKEARRLYSWQQAFTLSAVATKGIGGSSRISAEVAELYLTEVIEFIPITAEAKKTFEKFYE